MLAFQLIFAVAASYCLCVSGQIEVDCWEQVEQECDYSSFPEEVPATVEKLRDVCSYIKELGACILRVRDSCSKDVNDTEEFREILAYIHGVCREDSEVFQAVSSNLECIGSVSQDVFEKCHMFAFSDATKELIMNTVSEYAAKTQGENGADQASCLETLWEAYCPSLQVGIKCGFEAGAAVKDILLNVEENPMCTDEFIEEITPMLEIIEVAIVQEAVLNQMEENEEESQSEEASRRRRFASPFQSFRDKLLMKK